MACPYKLNLVPCSHFAFFDDTKSIVKMEEQEVSLTGNGYRISIIYVQYYLDNTFGLKTIHSRGGVHIHAIPGVTHLEWHGSKDVFDCCIAPYLN